MKGINSMDVRGLKLKPTGWDVDYYFRTVEVGDWAQLIGKNAYSLHGNYNQGWRMNGEVISKSDDGKLVEIKFFNNGRYQTRTFNEDMRCTEKLINQFECEYHFYWWILPYLAECYSKVRNWYWKNKEPRTQAEIQEELKEAYIKYGDKWDWKGIRGRILAPNTEAFPKSYDEIEF
jgi:hypothetical protein